MFSIRAFFSFAVFSVLTGSAQNTDATRDSIHKYTQIDFSNMKDQLGIKTENRPGPSGNPEDSNAANSNEELVKPYTLPDPLLTKDKKPVTAADQLYDIRRPEISEDFEREMYGLLPENIPSVTWTVKQEKDTMVGPYPVTERILSERWIIPRTPKSKWKSNC